MAGLRPSATLTAFAADHLRQKAEFDDVTDKWLEANERYLSHAVTFFGAGRELTEIRPSHIRNWMRWIRRNIPGRGGGAPSNGSVRHHLHALSNMYRTAQQEEVVPVGYNPVAARTGAVLRQVGQKKRGRLATLAARRTSLHCTRGSVALHGPAAVVDAP